MEFRIKRGADEGANHRLACLLNADCPAGAPLDIQNRIDEPLQHLGAIGHSVAAALRFCFVVRLYRKTASHFSRSTLLSVVGVLPPPDRI